MERTNSVDFFRLFAAFAVVSLHVYIGTVPLEVTIYLRLLARYAVPFFFLISGYFFYFSVNRNGGEALLKNLHKLIGIYVVTWCIYLPKCILKDKFVFDYPLLFTGTDGHLWFLTSLVFGLIFCWYFKNLVKKKILLIFLILVFLTPCLIFHYLNAFGISNSIGETFSRFVLSVPFLLMGMTIAHYRLKLGKISASLVIILSLALLFVEVYIFNRENYGNLWRIEFLLNTIPLSIGIFFLSFNFSVNDQLASYGRTYALGIYLYHQLFNTLTYNLILYLFPGFSEHIFLFNPVICFFSTLGILMFIKRFLPELFRILNGDLIFLNNKNSIPFFTGK